MTNGEVLGAVGTYAAACGCYERSQGGDQGARGGEGGRPRQGQSKRGVRGGCREGEGGGASGLYYCFGVDS